MPYANSLAFRAWYAQRLRRRRQAPLGGWLLATGQWIDSQHWIDSEAWNDG